MKAAHVLLVGAVVLIAGTSVSAATYTYTPNDHDIYDLDHGRYYTWGMQQDFGSGEQILSAELFFDNIRNWNSADNDLWVHLLDVAPLGLRSYSDNSNQAIDAFAGQGVLLAHYEDLPATAQDLTITFNPSQINSLTTFATNDSVFALAFDPDCHFYNSGVTLTIATGETPDNDVPEPATMTLLVLGGIGALMRRRRPNR